MAVSESRCKAEPARVVPVIDRTRCEAKADCVRVCPYGVFEIRRVAPEERGTLGFFARAKLFVHGGKQAYAARPDTCHACGLCVTACPEDAIRLVAAH
jgi:NAD-dependent dihydropyrimidine dehydrogenase PreA subunit